MRELNYLAQFGAPPPSRAGTDVDDGSHVVEAAELHSLPASHLHSSQQDGEEEQS